MQQFVIEHKKIATEQVVKEEKVVVENKRLGHGRNIAISRNVYRLLNSDTFYVQSEKSNDLYYFVKFKPDVFEWCCCIDNSTRHVKCKHQFAIEYAILKGTLKDIDKLPVEAKKYGSTTAAVTSKSYREDDYDF